MPGANGLYATPTILDLLGPNWARDLPPPVADYLRPRLQSLSLARLSADLSQLRVGLPPAGSGAPNNSVAIVASLDNVRVGFDDTSLGSGTHVPYLVRARRVAVECTATMGAPLPGRCGEIPVTCTRATATFTDFTHDFTALALFDIEGIVRAQLQTALSRGVVLHFNGFAPTALRVTGPGLLQLAGANDDGCSHAPPLPPRPAPVRGLVRARAVAGKGEFIGSQGSVIPFDLLPEVKVDWSGQPLPGAFLPWSVAQPPASGHPYRVYGHELPRPLPALPSEFEASVELVRHVQNNCWLKPAGLSTILEPLFPPGRTRGRQKPGCGDECGCVTCDPGGKFLFEVVAPDGTSFVTRDARIVGAGDRVVVQSVRGADFVAEVAPRLARVDGQLCPGPNCPDRCSNSPCSPWVRLGLVADPAPPFPNVGNGPPWEVVLWAGRSLEAVSRDLSPRCPLTPIGNDGIETIVGQRILVAPEVTFGRMMVDSAEFPAAELTGSNADGSPWATGLFPPAERGSAFVRTTVRDDYADNAVRIVLTEQCSAHMLGQPHAPTPCWTGTFRLPDPAVVQLPRAVSGMTVPRVDLEDALSGDPVASAIALLRLGTRTGAVQGTLDRSGLRFFTRVPAIYNQLGITSEFADYRGILEVEDAQPGARMRDRGAFLDWEHDARTFPVPWDNDPSPIENQHPDASRRRWLRQNHSVRYFANWRSDELIVRWTGDEPFSFCPRLDQLEATPLEFAFTGAGLGSAPRLLPASDVLRSGPIGPDGRFRLTPTSGPAWGRLDRVLPP